ncbi:MAG: cytochrome C [Alphaproteobacteria bacterium]|nr:MAG: cytochrome C [Alphaproteobacteria bacterium]
MVAKPSSSRRWRRILGLMALAVAAALLVFTVWAREPAIAAIERPDPARFDRRQVASGAALARIGNCASCHTVSGGRVYAGGTPIRTPFGTIHGSNITPDPETGIGTWSYEAFARSMREGVGRDGSHLYPAFPYDRLRHTGEADLRALYAFLMTRDAVRAEPPANTLVPPLGWRPVLAGWKLLALPRRAPQAPQPQLGKLWERGRYLGEGLAHCGSCHSPRGILQQELRDRAYAGGWSDGWYAPPLDATSPAVRAWTTQRLYAYFRTGLSTAHAAAAGPMGPVTHNLARTPGGDVRALAAYYAWTMRDAPAARAEPALPDRAALAARRHPAGAALFRGACAACHEPGAAMMAAGRPDLRLGSPLHEDNPRDTVQIILQGLEPPVEPNGPYMPGYADTLTDAQIAAITAYMRARWGSGPDWGDIEQAVADARDGSSK